MYWKDFEVTDPFALGIRDELVMRRYNDIQARELSKEFWGINPRRKMVQDFIDEHWNDWLKEAENENS